MENNDSVRLLEKDGPILFARDLTLGMYDLSGDGEDPGGVVEARRMVAGVGEGQWVKEGMGKRQVMKEGMDER